MKNARQLACGILAATLGWVAPMMALAEPGIGKSTIRIGQSAGVSGPVAGSVKEQIAGAQVYLNHVNANGGVAGRKIELLTYDDGFDAKRTPDNVRKLIGEDKVFALFMVRGTPQNESILPIIGAEKVPLIAPLTGAITLHRPVNRYVFNVRAKYQDEVARAINHLATSGMSRIAIFYANDGFGQDVFEGFNTALQARGVQPAGAASFNRPMGDISQGVATVNKANPQAVMVIGSGSEAARIIREMKKAGSAAQFVTLSNNAADSFIKGAGRRRQGPDHHAGGARHEFQPDEHCQRISRHGQGAESGAQQCRHGRFHVGQGAGGRTAARRARAHARKADRRAGKPARLRSRRHPDQLQPHAPHRFVVRRNVDRLVDGQADPLSGPAVRSAPGLTGAARRPGWRAQGAAV
ncbi:hypothetical protein GCM10009080_51190 [Cupriavidus pauculus]